MSSGKCMSWICTPIKAHSTILLLPLTDGFFCGCHADVLYHRPWVHCSSRQQLERCHAACLPPTAALLNLSFLIAPATDIAHQMSFPTRSIALELPCRLTLRRSYRHYRPQPPPLKACNHWRPALLWQPAQENTVLSPKPIHFGH
jgi:hypothetical protein